MSHTMELKAKLNDKEVVLQVARRLGYKIEENKKVNFYSSSAEGTAVHLPGWKYPIVISDDGSVYYDNYDGAWGKEEELHKFEAEYSLEKIKRDAALNGYGYTVDETEDEYILEIDYDDGMEG